MPRCWCLKDKQGNLVDPVKLDERICLALGVVPDPTHYVEEWWDEVGCALMCGKSLQEINQEAQTSWFATRKDQIIWEILSEYTGRTWYQSRS